MLRSLRHYRLETLHKTKDSIPSIDWRREAWKEEVSDDLSIKGRQRTIFSQTNIETVLKATLGKFLRGGTEHIMGFGLNENLFETKYRYNGSSCAHQKTFGS